jgi:rRNA maturation protein Rpf1
MHQLWKDHDERRNRNAPWSKMPILQRKDLQESSTRLVKKSENSMILTTSKRPCERSRTLLKELQCVIPLSGYILRGKKGIRELISLSVEKGAERTIVVTSKGNNPYSLLFYSEWNFLGELIISVILRRELSIPKVKSIREDIPFLLKSSEKEANTIADLFDADLFDATHVIEDAYSFMTYERGWIDFYRLDVSDRFIGPRINVKMVNYASHN